MTPKVNPQVFGQSFENYTSHPSFYMSSKCEDHARLFKPMPTSLLVGTNALGYLRFFGRI
jgi:hypothetical protein